jgi:hypothetical protein
MKRMTMVVAVLLATGCTWSNSLYHARRLSRAAERAERENRPFEAGTYWGQAATKADTAYARSPDGKGGAEALWLRGHALARLNDCASATPLLERAWLVMPEAEWRDELLLDLGRCRDRVGDSRSLAAFMPLLDSPDSAVRLEAHARAGRAMVTLERWDEALATLVGVPGNPARVDRSIALAAVNRTDDAIREVEPLLVAQDTTVTWERLLGSLADRDAADAVSLLDRLVAFRSPNAPSARLLSAWQLAVALGKSVPPTLRTSLLKEAARPVGVPAASQARVRLAEYQLATADSPDSLTALSSAWDALTDGDPTAGLVLGRYRRLIVDLKREADSIVAGAPQGDLIFFHQAEIARDSLASPQTASWFLRRIEPGWPSSPYLPKVLFMRIALEPDSAAALRDRLTMFPDSPYLAYTRGEAGVGFRALEDSLARFLSGRAAAAATRQFRAPQATPDFE